MDTEHHVWEAMALKAAETAMEKAMIQIIGEKGVAPNVKLNAIKRVLVHQYNVTRAYEQAMSNY